MTVDYIKAHFPHFTSIELVNSDKLSVASTNIKTKALRINVPKFSLLPFEHQFFVLAHEEGHGVVHTKDELLADKYAYDKYEKYNLSNAEAVKALHLYLDMTNPVHQARVWQQIQRSLKNDYEEFGIKEAYRNHYETIPETKKRLKKILYANLKKRC